jgi:DNA-binding XRE family transcriptional regulator
LPAFRLVKDRSCHALGDEYIIQPHGYICNVNWLRFKGFSRRGAVMTNPTWFAGRLRELREKAGLTQEQLAERAGVKRDAVARWESGRREPGWSNVLALCAALGVTCEAFTQEPKERQPVGPGRPRKAGKL